VVVTLHGSNVNGAVLPIRKIGEICRRNNILYVVDAAQTAGLIPIDMMKDNIDILAFSGHKSLYGPPGTGGLCIKNELEIEPAFQGGTGSRSEIAEHPGFYPDRLEAGTLNTLGIIGLKAGLKYLSDRNHEGIFLHQQQLTMFFISKLREMDRVDLYLPTSPENSLPVVSCNFKGISPSQAALELDRRFGIMARAGLHCAPLAHKSIGTFPQGTVRISPGIFTTQEQIEYTLESIKKMISHKL
jgi:selenocysteine lyase/cysteine desulfurase